MEKRIVKWHYPRNPEAVCRYIHRRRRQLNISVEQLAERSEINQGTISRLERTLVTARLFTAHNLLIALQTDVRYLTYVQNGKPVKGCTINEIGKYARSLRDGSLQYKLAQKAGHDVHTLWAIESGKNIALSVFYDVSRVYARVALALAKHSQKR